MVSRRGPPTCCSLLTATHCYSPGKDVIVGDHLGMLRTLHPQPPRRDSRGQHDALKALEVGGAHARAELHLLRVRVGVKVRARG